jgi:hypothetical protein
MIAAWMLYTAAVSLLLFAGARAADYLARAIGAPTRFVWAASMLAVLALSGRALVRGTQPQHSLTAPAVQTDAARFSMTFLTGDAPATKRVRAPASASERIHIFLIAAGGAMQTVRESARRIDVASLDRWNVVLGGLWATLSCLALAWLAGSFVGLRRIERELPTELVDDHPVLVSKDVGPALLGVVRSRVVIPRWVLALPQAQRCIILAHERQHAAAYDPAMLYSGALMLALQPWNVALWALFARLRLALEADCDRRVLGATGDVRQYGALLVAVYERSTPGFTPYSAFAERSSNLERRIRRMTRRPRLWSIAGALSAATALVLSTAAWTMSAPVRRPVAPASVVPSAAPSVVPSAEPKRAGSLETMTTSASQHSQLEQPAARQREPAPRTMQLNPCMADGRIRTLIAPPGRAARDGSCSIDGDVAVVALDSSRVLVAVRDTADAAVENVDYFVFTSTTTAIPIDLAWSTRTGHAELSGAMFYVASPEPGTPGLAFGPSASELDARYPDARRFVIQNLEVLRRPWMTWALLRQLPTAARCASPSPNTIQLRDPKERSSSGKSAPLFIVDGMVVSDGTPPPACFTIGGQAVFLP